MQYTLRYIVSWGLLLACCWSTGAQSAYGDRSQAQFSVDSVAVHESLTPVGSLEVDTLHTESPAMTTVVRDTTIVIDQDEEALNTPVKTPVYQGAYLNLDILNPIMTAFNGGIFQCVISADVSLWQRMFPAIEVGVMTWDYPQETYHYQTTGMFTRVGVNYNFLNFKNDRKADHALMVGVRYGYSHTAYSTTDAVLHSDYWNETVTVNQDRLQSDSGWVEFLITVRAQVYKALCIGLTGRCCTFHHFYQPTPLYPTVVAGYGYYGSGTVNFGLDLLITYQIPYPQKKY